jgi:hypothetical protein
MKSRLARAFVFLIVLCCLVPLAALAAVLFLQAPVAPTALVALFVLVLLAKRLFALLSDTGADRPGMTDESTYQAGLSARDR